MFLNIQKFVKLIKDAYKTKLQVGYLDDQFIVSSGFWAVSIDDTQVHNKIKAVIMELVGKLPEYGEIFEVSKDNPMPQLIIKSNSAETYLSHCKNANIKMFVTPIIHRKFKDIRLLQNSNTKSIVGIAEEYFQMIDKDEIDFDIEGEPVGPVCTNFSDHIYWYNSMGRVLIMPYRLKDDELLATLSTVDFDDNKEVE